MNLQPLFTTARVVTAVYRIVSTSLLLVYLAQRMKDGKRASRRSHIGDDTHYRRYREH